MSNRISDKNSDIISNKITLRAATTKDAEGILAVYIPYILNTTITYEYEIPTVEEFRERIRKVTKFYPYLVCEEEGEIVGYAYASQHLERAAFQWGQRFQSISKKIIMEMVSQLDYMIKLLIFYINKVFIRFMH